MNNLPEFGAFIEISRNMQVYSVFLINFVFQAVPSTSKHIVQTQIRSKLYGITIINYIIFVIIQTCIIF